jgi:catechol 2,3-dioxygenase-like lactoylglutathione lyase family enzyme
MEWKLELVFVPVSDVDRAKAFYTEKAGFNADHDHRVSEEIRFVQHNESFSLVNTAPTPSPITRV